MKIIPTIFLVHPVGIGSTRMMNVWSAKLWLRAFVDLLPDVVISAPWLPYAEVNIDRERGIRDALICAESCFGMVAVGGEFSRGMRTEWDLFTKLGRAQIDLTRKPMPGILSNESFGETQTPAFRQAVTKAFTPVSMRAAA